MTANLQLLTTTPKTKNKSKLGKQLIKKKLQHRLRTAPYSGKGNRLPGFQEAQSVPKKLGPKEEHTKAHHHSITQD